MSDKRKLLELNEDALDQVAGGELHVKGGGDSGATIVLGTSKGTHTCCVCGQTKYDEFRYYSQNGLYKYVCSSCEMPTPGTGGGVPYTR